MTLEYYPITYEFIFPDGRNRKYEIKLNKDKLTFAQEETHEKPAWTALDRCQCKGCPLDKKTSPYCPVATNIAGLVEHFNQESSTAEVMIRVTVPERVYLKKTALQFGLFSILGVIMATSGCPHMNFLKPMARFHLPFSSSAETMVRSISMYLLRQYFQKKSGKEIDFELKDLDRRYTIVQQVNEGILSRIRSVVTGGDAQGNAMVILHTISQLLTMEIGEKLNSISYLFDET
jgi:hypothetical protein